MADTTRPERLPIKVVLPNQGNRRPVLGGGSSPTPFREVDHEFPRVTSEPSHGDSSRTC